MTNRQICSDVVEFLRANNIDDKYSYRFILSELRDAAQNYIKQDADNRRIFKQSNLWKSIPCPIQMEEVPLVECDIEVDCTVIMKSVEKIPPTYATIYGNLLKLSNIDGSGTYKQIFPADYQDEVSRKYRDKSIVYYWVIDDYIYIPDKYIQNIKVIGFFKDHTYLKIKDCLKSTSCIHPLDMEFNCPDYLVKVVKSDIESKLLQGSQKPVDNNPNLNNAS